MFIEPFVTEYPTINELSPAQEKSYTLIKKQFDNLKFMELMGCESYIMLYMDELIKDLLSEAKPLEYYTEKFVFLKNNYFNSFIQNYCTIWLGDIYYFFGKMEKALVTYVSGLKPEKIWTLLSTKVISLKLLLNTQLKAVEMLSFKKNITKYGKNNMDLVVRYVDNILDQDYSDGTISNKYFLDDDKKKEIPAYLFTGSYFGYYINQVYNKKKNAQKVLDIESLEKLTSYIYGVSRRAENAIREDLGMPKIGEGWISETELYYKLKKHFKNLTVIQHYNSSWLGKQHLDVFIEEINTGIEYHGLQHYQPIDFFGGKEAFITNQKRDKNKLKKCKKANVSLIIVREGYSFEKLLTDIEEVRKAVNQPFP